MITQVAGSASAATKPRWVPAPWDEIAKGRAGSLLVIDVTESTRHRRSPCYDHYKAHPTEQTAGRIEILLLERFPRLPQGVACPALAIRGPFLVPVHLNAPYRGQVLIDAATGRRHTLLARSALH